MNKKIELQLDLQDILNYVESAIISLKNENSGLDKDEIIMYLSSIPEIVGEIRKILIEMRVINE